MVVEVKPLCFPDRGDERSSGRGGRQDARSTRSSPFFSFFTFVLLVTGGLEALRKGQMTVFLAGEKVRMFEKSLFSSRLYHLL